MGNFIVWIIGGDDNESIYVRKLIASHPLINAKYENGTVMIWGRVENETLPELLSRSEVLVMPSYREQFGMVAIEAMLCGCPVIGARVGGLNDLIIQQETGYLFERGDCLSLCSVLSGFLRNKPERIEMRLKAACWARRFSQEKTFNLITKVYWGDTEFIPDFWEDAEKSKNIDALKKNAEKLLDEKIDSIEILRASQRHLCIKVTVGGMQYFVKQLNNQTSSTNYIFPINFNLYGTPKSKKEQFMRELYPINNFIAPRVIKYNAENCILINEYIETCKENILENTTIISNLIAQIRTYRPILRNESIIVEYYNTLQDFLSDRCLEQIDRFDIIASKINERITKGDPNFSRIHPQIELFRIKLIIEKRGWCLPPSVEHCFLTIIDYLIINIELNNDLPKFSHGDIKENHFLKDDTHILLCDWEHAKYCVGPLDEAKATFNLFYNQDKNIHNALKFLFKLVSHNVVQFKQAIVWFVLQVIADSVYKSTQGDSKAISRASSYLDSLIPYMKNHIKINL